VKVWHTSHGTDYGDVVILQKDARAVAKALKRSVYDIQDLLQVLLSTSATSATCIVCTMVHA